MIIKIQKVSIYIYIALMALTFISTVAFMTDYFKLYIYGTGDMGKFYNVLQIFNKKYFNQVLALIILSIILYITNIKSGRVNLVTMIYSIVVFIIIAIIIIMNISELGELERTYLSFDFSEVKDYVSTTFWFDFIRKVGIVFMAFNLFFAGIIVTNFVKIKKEGL